jgi:serine/threonine protein kinase
VIGNLLANRYMIISQLGGGGMALVYKAKDTLLNRTVTVKILRPEHTGDEEFVSRFREEAQAVAVLSHPNIVSVYDVGQENDTHFIVMEYVEGRNLKQIIKEMGKIPINHASDIARQICDGLQHAHENGIVHRDVKPHNILVMDNGRIKVTDFGIAQMMSSVTITNSGTIVGSVHYFSPEQAKGTATGTKSDIYSVGVVLYEMVTGRIPFDGDSPIAIALKQIQEQPIPPSKLNSQVSPELEQLILRAMEKDPNMRFRSAGEMSKELRKLFALETIDDTRIMAADEFATRIISGPVIITKEKSIDDEASYKKKKRKLKPLAKILIAVMVIGILAGAVYGMSIFFNVPEVKVPDVTKMPLEDAKKQLTAANLKSEVQLRNDPNVESNNVIDQDPGPEKMVKENTVIVLTVSSGPVLKEVPDVVKKEREAAEIELTNVGFAVSVSEDFSEDVPVGAVVSQIPEGKTDAIEGTTVKIVVSKGVEPKPVVVPNLVGKSLEEAKTLLQTAELKLSSDITQEESTEYLSGTIIRQDPVPENTQVQEGTEVKVVLSKGPGPEPKTARVNVELPNDGLVHKVKIVVQDTAGTRVALASEEHNSGEVFTRVVTYYNRGKIQVFIDDFTKPWREELVE